MKNFVVLFIGILFLSGCGSDTPQSSMTTPKPSKVSFTDNAQKDFIQEGIQSLKKADVTAAIQSFDSAIKANPNSAEPYLLLGQTYMNLQDYNRAIDSFNAATRVAPQEGQIYFMLALNHKLAGNSTDAAKYAERSIQLFRDAQDDQNFKKAVVFLQSLSAQEQAAKQ